MKIIFISDIHGCTKKLKKIDEIIINGDFDKIVVLGDLYYPGPANSHCDDINVDSVKKFLTEYANKLIVIEGNCLYKIIGFSYMYGFIINMC